MGLKLWKVIDCLGSHTLKDLTNAIDCVNDYHEADSMLEKNDKDDDDDNNDERFENLDEVYHRDSYYLIENEVYVESSSPNPHAVADRLYRMMCDQIVESNKFKPFGK